MVVGGTGGDGDGDSATGEPIEACQSSTSTTWSCVVRSLDSPCPFAALALDLQGRPFTDTPEPSTIEDARCVLRALRDRAPGTIAFVTEAEPGSGIQFFAGRVFTFDILEGGTVVRSHSYSSNMTSEQSFAHVVPKDNAFFDACLTQDFGPELFTCLTDWASDTPPAECPPCDVPLPIPECHSGDSEFPLCASSVNLCPEVFLDLHGQPFPAGDPTELPTSAIEDFGCALRALRDRTPGVVRFTTEYSETPFLPPLARTHYTFQIFQDGSFVQSRRSWQDLSSNSSFLHRMPKSADFFETCLTYDFGQPLFDCFVSWYEGEAPDACPMCAAP